MHRVDQPLAAPFWNPGIKKPAMVAGNECRDSDTQDRKAFEKGFCHQVVLEGMVEGPKALAQAFCSLSKCLYVWNISFRSP